MSTEEDDAVAVSAEQTALNKAHMQIHVLNTRLMAASKEIDHFASLAAREKERADAAAAAADKAEDARAKAERESGRVVKAADIARASTVETTERHIRTLVADHRRELESVRNEAAERIDALRAQVDGLSANQATVDGLTMGQWRDRALAAEAMTRDRDILAMLRDGAALSGRSRAKGTGIDGMTLADWIAWAEGRVGERSPTTSKRPKR